MVTDIFETWAKQLNEKMKTEKRKIVLFVDNCSAHTSISLEAVKIIFLPPNTTSVIQPMDQGIIKAFKFHYRKLVLQSIIDYMELHGRKPTDNIDVMQAMRFIQLAWNRVTQQTIHHCFKHGFGLGAVDGGKTTENIDELTSMVQAVEKGSAITSGK